MYIICTYRHRVLEVPSRKFHVVVRADYEELVKARSRYRLSLGSKRRRKAQYEDDDGVAQESASDLKEAMFLIQCHWYCTTDLKE